jgi:AmmeMemoRadiSam system protein B/AmmeMemoRadiSam system protein A
MTRQPAVAGQFYPAEPGALAAMVDSMLEAAEGPAPAGRVVAIQVPHAGYPYSGPTAARAFRLVGRAKGLTVVMVGPSHRVRIDKAVVFGRGSWHTPLGDVAVDEELARAVVGGSRFIADRPEAQAQEHSLEVQLPFLQRTLGEFKIVPIMVLEPTLAECEQLGRAIARACKGRNVVLLASSDLYHGYSYTDAKKTDSLTVSRFLGLDPKALYEALAADSAQACGGYAIVAVMVAARELGAGRAVLLGQTNSNDVMNERGGYCVGYSAVAFMADEERQEQTGEAAGRGELNENEQRSLLEIARRTIESYIREGKRPPVKAATERLKEPRGVFVTLHEHGELRGCIGYVEAVKPVYEAVSEMAVAASTEDPRFEPVRPEELASIDIEITVLTPLQPLADPESVTVGRHGLVVRKGFNSGLLLPQVPVEQRWNRQQFLEHTCLKAGLPRNAWKDKETRLFVFAGQVFGEKGPGR